MQYRSQVRKVGAELSCVDVVLTGHGPPICPDVGCCSIALLAQRSTIMSIALLAQRSTIMSIWYNHLYFVQLLKKNEE